MLNAIAEYYYTLVDFEVVRSPYLNTLFMTRTQKTKGASDLLYRVMPVWHNEISNEVTTCIVSFVLMIVLSHNKTKHHIRLPRSECCVSRYAENGISQLVKANKFCLRDEQ